MLQPGHPELGAIESVHYVERPQSYISFVISSLVTVLAAAGLFIIGIPACGGVVLLILVPICIDLIRGRRNSLEIRSNGLVYNGLFRARVCRWEDVEEFGHVLDDGTIPKDDPRYVRRARAFSVWVVKRGGGTINIRPDLTRIRDAVRSIAVHVFGPEHVAEFPDDYGTGSISSTRTVREIGSSEAE